MAGSSAFGVMGLGVMGRNLALNIEEHGFPVAVWNLERETTDAFMAENGAKRFTAAKDIPAFLDALERPRRILIMIKAGAPVDETLAKLKPLLQSGDIVIDGGNSWFEDTRRREADYRASGLHFVGMGVSGGEEGARHGPSLMPGGTEHAWERLKPILEAIAAKTESGPCVTHVGPDGAGHFVKMVHNGIEYGDMQLLAEVYDVLARGAGLDSAALARLFEGWKQGALESFLVDITAKIFTVKDAATGKPLVEQILDSAGQKGTGRLTVSIALELGVAVPTIAAAVDARVLSSLKQERTAASAKLKGPADRPALDAEALQSDAFDALLLGRICSYAQGMALIRAGSDKFEWKIDLSEMARIWKGGCIIRSALLDRIMNAFARTPPPVNLIVADDIAEVAIERQAGLRRFAAAAVAAGIPVPALSASIAWYDSYRSDRLPQNLTQAQRDAFGAHTYVRLDDPTGTPQHTAWL